MCEYSRDYTSWQAGSHESPAPRSQINRSMVMSGNVLYWRNLDLMYLYTSRAPQIISGTTE